MICKNCGQENPDNAQFCSLCSANLREQRGVSRPAPPPPSAPAQRRAATMRELEDKARRRRTMEMVTTPLLALVAAGLIFLIVKSFGASRAANPLVTDADFVGAATLYLNANRDANWQAMWDCFSSSVKQAMPFEEFQKHVGEGYLRQITEFRMVDFSYFDQAETKAYMAVNTTLGPQALFLVKEGEHWKIAWSFPVEDITGLDIPF